MRFLFGSEQLIISLHLASDRVWELLVEESMIIKTLIVILIVLISFNNFILLERLITNYLIAIIKLIANYLISGRSKILSRIGTAYNFLSHVVMLDFLSPCLSRLESVIVFFLDARSVLPSSWWI